jgi:protein-disulfide reductase (glutathione)
MRVAAVSAACLGLLVLVAQSASAGSAELARGWGDGIEWQTLDVAKQIAKQTQRPIMIIVHKTWCGACKRLKPLVAASEEIAELSSNFVMVNLEDSEEPEDAQFTPDGGYIPRVLFAGPSGRVDASIKNEGGNPKYRYFYTDAGGIVSSMRSAMSKFQPKQEL